jgi:hypothetical protein
LLFSRRSFHYGETLTDIGQYWVIEIPFQAGQGHLQFGI